MNRTRGEIKKQSQYTLTLNESARDDSRAVKLIKEDIKQTITGCPRLKHDRQVPQSLIHLTENHESLPVVFCIAIRPLRLIKTIDHAAS